jgi:hypothetical protein
MQDAYIRTLASEMYDTRRDWSLTIHAETIIPHPADGVGSSNSRTQPMRGGTAIIMTTKHVFLGMSQTPIAAIQTKDACRAPTGAVNSIVWNLLYPMSLMTRDAN